MTMEMLLALQFDFEDTRDEVVYWENAIVYYVIGSNPPFPVMEGFIRRIWGKKGIHKVVAYGKGLFLVRLKSLAQWDEILARGFQFFDKKPVVMKAWTVDMKLTKEEVKTVPIWIQLHNLDLKYLGGGGNVWPN